MKPESWRHFVQAYELPQPSYAASDTQFVISIALGFHLIPKISPSSSSFSKMVNFKAKV